MPGVASKGTIGLQHHGSRQGDKWVGPPSLLQYKDISIKELEK
jgi:hypothetical protein